MSNDKLTSDFLIEATHVIADGYIDQLPDGYFRHSGITIGFHLPNLALLMYENLLIPAMLGEVSELMDGRACWTEDDDTPALRVLAVFSIMTRGRDISDFGIKVLDRLAVSICQSLAEQQAAQATNDTGSIH